MKCKCGKCGNIFNATGENTFLLMTGGIECPVCGENIDLIMGKQKK